MLKKYIYDIKNFDEKSKIFIIRQIERMPDFYRFGVRLVCLLFYFFKIPPNKFKLLNKLFSSLNIVIVNENK